MTATYPNQLAAGFTDEGTYTPHHLWAGESPIVTDQVTAAVGKDFVQFEVYAKDRNGFAVAYNPDAGQAGGTLTMGGVPTAADTLTINGVVFTFKSSGIAASTDILIGTAAATAQALKAGINTNTATTGVTATGSSTVLTLEAVAEGTEGNAVTLVKSGTYPALSGATLTGGGDASAGIAVGFTAQRITGGTTGPVYTGGSPNHETLVWPASVDTIQKRKAAFDRTGVHPCKLL